MLGGMNVVPYVSAGGIAFGSSAASVEALLGPAQRTSTDRLGRLQLQFSELKVALKEGVVAEVTANCPTITVGAAAIPFQNLEYFLRRNDADAFEAVGFTVSPAYGVSVDPHFPSWVCVFARQELAAWMKHAD